MTVPVFPKPTRADRSATVVTRPVVCSGDTLRITAGSAYPFDCAAFDNTSKRHAYSLTPYRLVLKK